MGFSGNYCTLCGGPLVNAYDGWHEILGDEWPPDENDWRSWRPYPTKSREQIVTITEADGAHWEDGVVVSRFWSESHDWVSPGSASCGFNTPEVEGHDSWVNEEDAEPYLCLHRTCLSLLCRRLNTTPRGLWDAFFPAEHLARDPYSPDWPQYTSYDIEDRQGQEFEYAISRYGTRPDGKSEHWVDTDSMDACQWLLARPTVLPKLSPVPASARHPSPAVTLPVPALLRVLRIGELLQHVASFLETPPPRTPGDARVVAHPHLLRAYAGLLRTSRAAHALLAGRQDVYFALVRASGWMLPACPADWAEWRARGNPAVIEEGRWDWKTYLETCVRLEDPHVRNRWRIERILVQFGVPTQFQHSGEEVWQVGTAGRPAVLQEPEMFEWENVPSDSDSDEDT
ncbi:hypothetical protein BV25DRAFT_1918960 [Artomyces pyxidatus]|uniref:Uncharacterized protein n=1 Tax=Artomyces pyxidatus TaxID=48021 RepID=A0ACB8SRI7_9AGAM|nr:hypothetical protein BV25DRAFT_1918960 [Artomyces pyxidatus]